MAYIIGFDDVGTKTIGLLTDRNGRVLARAESGSFNSHAVGEAQTKKVLAHAISQLLTKVNATWEGCVACDGPVRCLFCLGWTGVDPR